MVGYTILGVLASVAIHGSLYVVITALMDLTGYRL